MADPNETPPATPPAQPATPPAKPPGQGAAPPNGHNGKGNGKNGKHRPFKAPPGFQLVPNNAFGERVKLEAARLLKKQLGIELDEAKKIVSDGGTLLSKGNEPKMVQDAIAAATAKVQSEVDGLKKTATTLAKKNEDWERKYKKDTQKLRDRATETELRFKATASGLVDTDYAVSLFARAVAGGKATDPDEFFKGLKTTHAHLFVAPAAPAVPPPVVPPVTVSPSTAPPESLQPGEKKPDPTNPTANGTGVDVDKLQPHEFAARTRSLYGFTPGV